MLKKCSGRPALFLLPFLFLYLIIVLLRQSDVPFGDETRYIWFSQNLLHGFYSPPPPEINLWNGPGFPLYLVPFVALGMPPLAIKLCNAILYYLALLLVNKTLSRFISAERSFVIVSIAGLYYMPFKSLPHILSEIFTVFLVASVAFTATFYFSSEKKGQQDGKGILLSALLAFLALTKVIFGHVFLFTGLVFLMIYLITRNRLYKKATIVLFGAIVLCSPYLVYTWNLTGKIFYWSNAGGMSIYWMSNPVAGEWGEWYNDSLSSPLGDPEAEKKLRINHGEEYARFRAYTGVERDEAFKEAALENIRQHPGKFFVNWLCNWSRMFFNYPAGYIPFRLSTLGNMLANIPLLCLLVYSGLLTWRKRSLPFALKFLLTIAGVYLLGASLLSAYDRMFYILTPIAVLWIGYSLTFFRDGHAAGQKSK
jgi:hypothetical protein